MSRGCLFAEGLPLALVEQVVERVRSAAVRGGSGSALLDSFRCPLLRMACELHRLRRCGTAGTSVVQRRAAVRPRAQVLAARRWDVRMVFMLLLVVVLLGWLRGRSRREA